VSGPAAGSEYRVLVLAASAKDAAIARSVLGGAGIESASCADVEALAAEMGRGAGALLIPEEALAAAGPLLADLVDRQPTWSDLPVLLLAQHGADSPAAVRALDLLGNVTLLERPVRMATLVSAARTALRARARQYQARAHLLALEEGDRRKDEFLATLAHELRNPLAPILNSVEILRLSPGSDPVVRPLADMMRRQVSHMVRLVDDLLEISRITRGKIELRKARVELSAVLDAALETSRPAIEAAGLALQVALPASPLPIDADPTRMAQVFANLLNNAAKYTDRGGRIDVRAAREGAEVVVRVADTGIGMAPDMVGRIFDMFVQADAKGARAQGGLGIGLTLARSVVEMHGGSIAAHSAGPGRGSEFVVRVPAAGADARTAARAERAPAAGPVDAPPRVLVVDDNHDAAESLAILLKVMGAQVEVVHDGPAAIAAVAVQRPAIVFLDIGMPQMSGYDVAREIRRGQGARAPVLVALTGWGQQKDREHSRAAGFDHHLVKPAEKEALRRLLAAPR
jgi:signal transduction histidine kinase